MTNKYLVKIAGDAARGMFMGVGPMENNIRQQHGHPKMGFGDTLSSSWAGGGRTDLESTWPAVKGGVAGAGAGAVLGLAAHKLSPTIRANFHGKGSALAGGLAGLVLGSYTGKVVGQVASLRGQAAEMHEKYSKK